MAAVKMPKISRPVQDPENVYPSLPEYLKGLHFGLGMLAPTPHEREKILERSLSHMQIQKKNFLGFQIDHEMEFAEEMAPYLNLHVNNIGDPFVDGNYTMNSKFMERAVLDYYASLWNAVWPHSPTNGESYWGCSLGMGSTEGNIYAMWNARDYLGGKMLLWQQEPLEVTDEGQPTLSSTLVIPDAYTPIAFYSEDTHYSLAKALCLTGIRTFHEVGIQLYPNQSPINGGWPKEVPSDNQGQINISALTLLVEFFASKGYPIIICFNFGSTSKGAYDDVQKSGDKLMPIFKKYGLDKREVHYDPSDPSKKDVRTGFWIHVDGALGAAYMPFKEMAHSEGLIKEKGPVSDFRLPYVHSISVSGHKWQGCPVPCGVYITKTKFRLSPFGRPDPVGSPDTTLAGSRNGLSPILLWHSLSKFSFEDQMNKALRNQRMADYVYQSLMKLQVRINKDLYIARSKLSLTVRFRQANARLCHKYSLPMETKKGRCYSHVFAMDHVSEALVDCLMEDLSQPNAFFEPLPFK